MTVPEEARRESEPTLHQALAKPESGNHKAYRRAMRLRRAPTQRRPCALRAVITQEAHERRRSSNARCRSG